MDERRRAVALFRYSLVREPANPGLSSRERGQMVRALASRDHWGPDGIRMRVSRQTLDRWIRAWRAGGFDALVPQTRSMPAATPAELLELAMALKREAPKRTAAQVAQIIRATRGDGPSSRTIQRLFQRTGLNRLAGADQPRVYGRFEAEHPNDLWTGDALHGPVVAGRKVYLFAFVDDHSRLLAGYRWGFSEDTVRLEDALRRGLAARGIPRAVYVDNGSAFVSHELLRACAVLGIRLVHSRPGEPAGRGKIERVFRTIRSQFLVELEMRGAAHLQELNVLFQAWVETIYHRRGHTETGQAPLQRFLVNGPPQLPSLEQLREAFLWSQRRLVTKTATVSLHGNVYEVDPALVGVTVELVFDPFDLSLVEVRYQDRHMGVAVPQKIGRHVHPRARREEPQTPVAPTGIDYLGLVRDRHQAELPDRIAYAAFTDPDETDISEDAAQTKEEDR